MNDDTYEKFKPLNIKEIINYALEQGYTLLEDQQSIKKHPLNLSHENEVYNLYFNGKTKDKRDIYLRITSDTNTIGNLTNEKGGLTRGLSCMTHVDKTKINNAIPGLDDDRMKNILWAYAHIGSPELATKIEINDNGLPKNI